MMIETLQETIKSLTERVLGTDGLFLVDIEVKGNEQNRIIWIYIDKQHDGVTVDACAKLSGELAFLIESQEIITGKFTLNVSSPGLDRPLTDKRQFDRHKGRKAKVKYTSDDGEKSAEGKLAEVNEHGIRIEPAKSSPQDISWDNLIETRIIPAF